MAPFDRLYTISYWPSIVTVTISCIVSKIKPDIDRKFHTPSHTTPP